MPLSLAWPTLALVLAAAVGPGRVGVFAGGRVRPAIPERYQTAATLGLLVVIAGRLTVAGLTGL